MQKKQDSNNNVRAVAEVLGWAAFRRASSRQTCPLVLMAQDPYLLRYVAEEFIAPTLDPVETRVYAFGCNGIIDRVAQEAASNMRLGLAQQSVNQYTLGKHIPRELCSLASERIVQAACGLEHSLFLTADGRVLSVGTNTLGQLGIGMPATASCAGWWGVHENPVPVDLGGVDARLDEAGTNGVVFFTKILASGLRSMALTRCGHVYVWGDMEHRFEQNDWWINRPSRRRHLWQERPSLMPGLAKEERVREIATSHYGANFAVTEAETVYAWGVNELCALGFPLQPRKREEYERWKAQRQMQVDARENKVGAVMDEAVSSETELDRDEFRRYRNYEHEPVEVVSLRSVKKAGERIKTICAGSFFTAILTSGGRLLYSGQRGDDYYLSPPFESFRAFSSAVAMPGVCACNAVECVMGNMFVYLSETCDSSCIATALDNTGFLMGAGYDYPVQVDADKHFGCNICGGYLGSKPQIAQSDYGTLSVETSGHLMFYPQMWMNPHYDTMLRAAGMEREEITHTLTGDIDPEDIAPAKKRQRMEIERAAAAPKFGKFIEQSREVHQDNAEAMKIMNELARRLVSPQSGGLDVTHRAGLDGALQLAQRVLENAQSNVAYIRDIIAIEERSASEADDRAVEQMQIRSIAAGYQSFFIITDIRK